jgi:hypothetical protein
MASRFREHDRACRCDLAAAGCAALSVRRLSEARVQELAEEIWTVSTGTAVAVQPVPDLRASRPGASAQAAYQRCRQEERQRWRGGWRWRSLAITGVALAAGLVAGLAMGAGLGWRTGLAAGLLAWWRLRFRPSASARRWRAQAMAQRRTAGTLAQLEQEGHLVLHDLSLPGWPASLDHLVIGPTGVWAIDSWHGGRPRWLRGAAAPRSTCGVDGPRPDLHGKAEAVAGGLAGTGVPVRPLLCRHHGIPPRGRRPDGIPLVVLRQLPEVVRNEPRVRPGEVERATARALEVFRPAA